MDHNVPTNITDELGRNVIQLARAHNAQQVLPILIQQGLLRAIRNDEENAHDSAVNEGCARIYQDLCNAVPLEKRFSFYQVESALRMYLAQRSEFTALQTLARIQQDGILEMAHLDNATEQEVIAMIWSLAEMNKDKSHDYTSSQTVPEIQNIPADALKQSLTEQLKNGWSEGENDTVCPSGRINRLLDTFTGLYQGASIVTVDIIRREMLDKAVMLRNHFHQQPLSEQQMPLSVYIRENLAHDYVDSGILSQRLFDRIVNEWISYIE